MNLDTIKSRVNDIREEGVSDCESAHAKEDDLYLDFITYISKHGTNKYKLMAKEILKTKKFNFPRHCS